MSVQKIQNEGKVCYSDLNLRIHPASNRHKLYSRLVLIKFLASVSNQALQEVGMDRSIQYMVNFEAI